jgi:NAD(P)-dependent dehydrogenase (short-subunit alcohol dehydrogenase family)
VRTEGPQGRLDGKRALISGTGGGIGRATDEAAHVSGANIPVDGGAAVVG